MLARPEHSYAITVALRACRKLCTFKIKARVVLLLVPLSMHMVHKIHNFTTGKSFL